MVSSKTLRAIGLFTAAVVASGAGAQAPKNGRWVVDWGEHRCTLVREIGGGTGITVLVRTYIGTHQPEVIIINPSWTKAPVSDRSSVELALLPGGHTVQVEAATGTTKADKTQLLLLSKLDNDFFDRFAEARGLSLTHRGEKLLNVGFAGSAAAINSLRACNDDLMKSWGVDLEARKRLQRMPLRKNPERMWLTHNDYPAAALNQNAQGPVVIRFIVGADGLPRECVPVVSSKNKDLDHRTCKALTSRVTFEPGLDENGKPVPVVLVQTVTWRLE